VPDGIGGIIIRFREWAYAPKSYKTIDVKVKREIASLKDRCPSDGGNSHGVK
jgi:hypothetical protein